MSKVQTMTIHTIINSLNSQLALRRSFMASQIEAARIANSVIEQHRQIAKIANQMCADQRELQNIVHQRQIAINSVQRTLSLLPTSNDILQIENLREDLSGEKKNRDFTRFDFTRFDEVLPKQSTPETQPKQKQLIGFRPPNKK